MLSRQAAFGVDSGGLSLSAALTSLLPDHAKISVVWNRLQPEHDIHRTFNR